MLCMCAPQYSEFCGKLFWALLYPPNVMCYMHFMMILVMVFPPNRWYMIKICMCHWWVSITGNTWRFDASSFDPHSVHIGLPPASQGSVYNCWNIYCGWIDHLWGWYTEKQAISDATDRILEFWFQILNLHKKLALVTYSMSYSSMISVVPFLIIIIVFAPARTADQIWWCPIQIPHLCGILHPLTFKSSYVEQVVRSPLNNLYYLNLLCNHWF